MYVLCSLSCSKLRAQLGLRPLDVGGGSKKEGEGQEGEGEEGIGKQEDVHVPAKNLGAEKSAQKVRKRSDFPHWYCGVQEGVHVPSVLHHGDT